MRLQGNYSGRIEQFNVTPCPIVATSTGVTLEINSDSTSTQVTYGTKRNDSAVVAILCIGVLILMVFSLVIFFRLRRQNMGNNLLDFNTSYLIYKK